jgi:hypothetical protein
MRKLTVSMVFLAIAALAFWPAGCSGDEGSGSSDDGDGATSSATEGGDDGGGTTEGATTADGGGDDDGGTTGEIPDCSFAPPQGATCNPYPDCPGTGCASGQICTVVAEGAKRRVQCAEPGTVALGGTCDLEGELTCSDGVCVESQCRAFCVGIEHCPNNASCAGMSGVPGKPTVCGATQADCDPLDADGSCPNGFACYLQSSGLTDCMVTQGGGQQGNACEAANGCAPGFTCTVSPDEQQICAQTVAAPEGQCEGCPAETQCKTLTDTVGACVPVPEGGDGGGTTGGPDPIPCDLLDQDCESSAQGCYPTNEGDQCLIKGNDAIGSECGNVNDCIPGATCFASRCKAICDPTNGLHPECETGPAAQCVPLSGDAGYCDE